MTNEQTNEETRNEGTKNEESRNEEEMFTEEEKDEKALVQILSGLPEDLVEKAKELIEMMNPNKPGFEGMSDTTWEPAIVKIHQAMSEDAPGASKQGDIYTDMGDILPAPFELIPVYIYKSRMRFDPTLCLSEDQIISNSGDLCVDCPDRPFRDGKRTKCSNAINVFAFNKECTQIFKLRFSNVSEKAGRTLYKQAKGGPVLWAKIFAVGTEKRQRTGGEPGSYYIFTTKATGERTREELYPLINFIKEKIHAAREKSLAETKERVSTAQKVVDNMPSDFGGEGAAEGDSKGQPDFTDM